MVCKECGRRPTEIEEYTSSSEYEGISPNEYVSNYEETYNPEKGLFYCPECYLAVGMPEGVAE